MIHKKRKKNASFGFSGHNQGRFRPVSAVSRPVSAVSAVSAAGRYVPIWPIRPDFGRISPIRRESKPIQHESSRIGANPRKKKKKKNPDAVRRAGNRVGRRVPRRAASDAGAAPLVPRPCILGNNGVVCTIACSVLPICASLPKCKYVWVFYLSVQ